MNEINSKVTDNWIIKSLCGLLLIFYFYSLSAVSQLISRKRHKRRGKVVHMWLPPTPHCSPKEALSLPDRQGINLEADTDQLWQSSTSTSALSAQQARCLSRLLGHRDGASDGLRGQRRAGSRKCERAHACVHVKAPSHPYKIQQSPPKPAFSPLFTAWFLASLVPCSSKRSRQRQRLGKQRFDSFINCYWSIYHYGNW